MKENICSFEMSKALLDAGLVEMGIPIVGGAYYGVNKTGPWLVTKRHDTEVPSFDCINLYNFDTLQYIRTGFACPAVSFSEVAGLVGVVHNSMEVEIDWFWGYKEGDIDSWASQCVWQADLIKRLWEKKENDRYIAIGKGLEAYCKMIEDFDATAYGPAMKDSLFQILKES